MFNSRGEHGTNTKDARYDSIAFCLHSWVLVCTNNNYLEYTDIISKN